MHTGMEERLRFERLLLEISARFVNIPADKVDSELRDAQHLWNPSGSRPKSLA